MMDRVIYTVGYGNMAPEEFVAKLKAAGITDVMDVRRKDSKGRLRAYDPGDGGGMEKLIKAADMRFTTEDQFGNEFVGLPNALAQYKAWLGERTDMVWCTAHGIFFFMRHSSNRKFCLLCGCGKPFEKDGKTPRCHRVYVAEALIEQLGAGWTGGHL